ncbi:MAG: hypothetical protein CM1200mP30_18460 [Pseudomonadota bacterium]|nr:MAG: hypothetical protein CM1200mP30_18460 [Pseudomonadota bacterium]
MSSENYTSGNNGKPTQTNLIRLGQRVWGKSKLVGKQLPHDSAVGHVTGEALFVDDITPAKNELIVDFISSPVAHGKIKNLNSMELARQDGISGVFTHSDIPGENHYGPVVQDEPILAAETVQYVGQPIAIIAGESHKAIREAKKKIRLNIKELKPVFTIDDAIAAKQYIGEKRTFKQGDFEKAWRDSEHKLKGTFVVMVRSSFIWNLKQLWPALESMVIYTFILQPRTPQKYRQLSQKL